MKRAWLALTLSLLSLPTLAQAPSLRLEVKTVVASGISPGGQAVFLGVAQEVEEYALKLVRLDRILADDDRDGVVRFDLDREVAHASIWVVVDLATGRWKAVTPKGYPLQLSGHEGRGPGRDGSGKPDRWDDDRSFLEILVVRPGEGAWGLTVGDGGKDDDDGRNDGHLSAALARMRGVGKGPGSPPPGQFRKRDLVFAIDPNQMELLGRDLGDEVER